MVSEISLGEDENIIYVSQGSLPIKPTEDYFHEGTEGTGGIFAAKGEDVKLKEAIHAGEGRFGFAFFI